MIETEKEFSQELSQASRLLTGASVPKFRLKYPKNVDDLTMKFLYLGIDNAIIKILDGIAKRNGGSNANPISVQVIKSGTVVKRKLESKISLKGREALSFFLETVKSHFNSDAPFISSLYRRYKIDQWTGVIGTDQEAAEELVKVAKLLNSKLGDDARYHAEGLLNEVKAVQSVIPKAIKELEGQAFGKSVPLRAVSQLIGLTSNLRKYGSEHVDYFFA